MRNSHIVNVPDILAGHINLATLISVPRKYNSIEDCPDEWCQFDHHHPKINYQILHSKHTHNKSAIHCHKKP
jgi:hypothetical protein